MNEIMNPAISIKKAKRKFSLENKKALYQQWKLSNKTKHAFCKAEGLSKATFYKWGRKLEKQEKINLQNNVSAFAPVIPRKTVSMAKELKTSEKISLELLLPNQTMIKFQLPLHHINHLIQEWCHAATIVR